jgi:hypothetical protein
VINQWIWNLRIELGHCLEPTAPRITEFALALLSPAECATSPSGYASPEVALRRIAGRFSGRNFALQPNGTLCCPAGRKRIAHMSAAGRPMEAFVSSIPEVTAVAAPGRMPRAVSMEWRSR